MTFDEFKIQWNGKGVDFDGAVGDQCMDLMHLYCLEVLDLVDPRILAAPAAKDVFLNFNNMVGKDYFTKINNTPTGIPQKGDIMFWGTGLGPYGHVAIVIDGNVNTFNSFDQNFPTGSKCHVQSHNYNGVLGWLRPKPQVQPTPVITSQTKIPAALLGTTQDMEVQALKSKLSELISTQTQLQQERTKNAALEGKLAQIKTLAS